MSDRIRFAIIGAGRIGQVHAENLTRYIPEAEVVLIADVVHEAAQKTAQRFGIPQASGAPSEVFANDDIDAVAICSSTDAHADLIIQSAAASAASTAARFSAIGFSQKTCSRGDGYE